MSGVEGGQLQRAVDLLRAYATVVFDLDGTLVRLRVDWGDAQADLGRITRRFGKESAGRTIWEMLREATGEEASALDQALRTYEMEGGARAMRLPIADVLSRLGEGAVGVVTLNCHACAEEALRSTGLSGFIGAIVARGDTTRLKPDPEPLLVCIQELGGEPGNAVFVGDRARDRETAEAAGTAFLAVNDLLREATRGES
ncbi:MAG: HAD-IA family hydrolase [Candidatus Thermoplasmatota archaeon]|nr:HAD-IA family hydrolase [Candidatus Thermoplasmatota archaeon]